MNALPMRAKRCLPWLLLSLLAACAPSAPPPHASGGERLQWRGERACADCDGIRTELQLTRQQGGGDYTLIETFLADDGNARFVETGRWQREPAGWLRLQSDQGGVRAYLLLPDGGLQPGDADGRAFATRPDAILAPVTPTQAP